MRDRAFFVGTGLIFKLGTTKWKGWRCRVLGCPVRLGGHHLPLLLCSVHGAVIQAGEKRALAALEADIDGVSQSEVTRYEIQLRRRARQAARRTATN